MTETMYDIPLAGCTPEPLMSYLKALGVLRLVSEQKDPDARGWWQNDVFWLRSTLEHDALVKFFLEEYRPTPLFSPWNGDGGFLSDSGTSVDTINWFRDNDADSRFQFIRDAILAVDQIPLMSEFRRKRDRAKELDKKRKAKKITNAEDDELKTIKRRVKEIKQTVVTAIRGEFPDASLRWLDSCLTIDLDGFASSPLLGSGGVDGRLDFGNNFLVNCREVLANPAPTKPRLEHALIGKSVALDEASIGQFSPGQVGAPNSTQGFEGVSLINRWDFLLMMEGSLLFAGAAVRRFGVTESSRAAFPFTVHAIAAGFDSPASKDEAESRGELWLPLWTRPVSRNELCHLLGEGRADVSGRPARDATDFARAVAGLGVDRGVRSFSRTAFLKRSGKAFLSTPLGRFDVRERAEAHLLREVDTWLGSFRRATGDKNAPSRFIAALRGIDSAIFDFCRYGGRPLFQRILVALGRAERELALTEGKVGNSKIKPKPLAGLSHDWINAVNDDTREFEIALAVSQLHDPAHNIGRLRANLEPAVIGRQKNGDLYSNWAEKDRSVVWNAGDLATNLANTLQRRLMDGQRNGCESLPIASCCAASLDAVAAFIQNELDDRRIEGLIWGLMLIDGFGASPPRQSPIGASGTPLPREYALLKLLFLPRPLAGDHQGNRIVWRLAREGESGITIRPEPRILPLLRAGRMGEACQIAAQRLRNSGLQPMPGPLLTGVIRDFDWAELSSDPRRGNRLAAALLIPIDSKNVNQLVELICRSQSTAAEAIATKFQEGDIQ